ncbi:MAG: (Fe-S)-binding protein [Acidilobus sp.]|uniref:(Fe-S)-binding protein n=1 Tax=Acidilobus sp. 7A TaxID=1577685 RepID=UPI000764EE3A|nr:(Fe-S)-binding protein [Acidilobus sp. 7A]AMD30488.1 Fe-S oxidoreductase [Acidilobus sp. 7A]
MAEELLREAQKCVYCGFCESVCPTMPFGPHRGYGPRGRVTVLRELLEGTVKLSDEVISSFYSCLLCNACSTVCPARIRVGDLMRSARLLLWGDMLTSEAAVRTR